MKVTELIRLLEQHMQEHGDTVVELDSEVYYEHDNDMCMKYRVAQGATSGYESFFIY